MTEAFSKYLKAAQEAAARASHHKMEAVRFSRAVQRDVFGPEVGGRAHLHAAFAHLQAAKASQACVDAWEDDQSIELSDGITNFEVQAMEAAAEASRIADSMIPDEDSREAVAEAQHAIGATKEAVEASVWAAVCHFEVAERGF